MDGTIIIVFSNITRTDEATACKYLQKFNWDIKQAIEKWMEEVISTCDEKKEPRGIALARDNKHLVKKARVAILKDLSANYFYKSNNYLMPPPETVFILPNVNSYCPELQAFIMKDLVETSTLKTLERSGRLNWWKMELGEYSKLWPMQTVGDGNCLLHAASLSIWGFNDQYLTLRVALHQLFTNSLITPSLKRRWKWQQLLANKQTGVVYNENEWEKEWTTVLELVSPASRNPTTELGIYGSLEEIHILGLAHLLQRVIIVISDSVLNDLHDQPLSPINFGGIYLPFEANENDCHKVPIILCFDVGHFSSLCYMDCNGADNQVFLMPLEELNGTALPIQFFYDPGVNFNWETDSANALEIINNERDRLNILRTFLNIVDAFGGSNSECDSEEEIEQRFTEPISQEDDACISLFSNRNKAAKQLQMIGRQFGSLGKNMSKKLRKNFGSLPIITKNKKLNRKKLICAEINISIHPYQRELSNNYLVFAYERFLLQSLHLDENEGNSVSFKQALDEGPLKCINKHCQSHATVLTSYMCKKCYEDQKTRENIHTTCYVGIGKSRFYSEPDNASYDAIKNLPKPSIKQDKTLYLSNSTFYNDSDEPLNNNVPPSSEKDEEIASIISSFDFSSIKVPEPRRKSVQVIGDRRKERKVMDDITLSNGQAVTSIKKDCKENQSTKVCKQEHAD